MLYCLPVALWVLLGAYLVRCEVRSVNPPIARALSFIDDAVSRTARLRRRAARSSTDPNDAARLSGSWG